MLTKQERWRRAGGMGLALGFGLAGWLVAQGAPGATELRSRVEAVARAAAAEGFQGVVLVAKDGEELFAQGYGKARETPPVAYAVDTVVPVGSCVKDFTRVAVYQWIEAGHLNLTDTIGTFFPDAPADKRGITVEQLLGHRSGLPLGVEGGDRRLLTHDEFLRAVWAVPLEFPPGTSERYSNTGYSVLAAIVERLAGEPFDAYVEKRILEPAGLHETGLLARTFAPERLAHAYDEGEDRGTMYDLPHLPDGVGWAMRGNGGYVSTLRDMLRFYRAVRGTALLADPAHRDAVVAGGGPTVLAGSDLVSFFLFGSFPGAGLEVLIASNHAEWKATTLLERLEPVLGVGRGGARGPVLPALPDSGPGRAVRDYLAAFNSGGEAVMRRYYAEHPANGPDAPPVEKRLEGYRRLHGDFGALTVKGVRATPDGFEVEAESGKGEIVTLTFAVAPDPPFALRGIRVDLGGHPQRAGSGGGAPRPTVAMPDTAAGAIVAGYLEAYNSGDESVLRRFLEQHAVPPPQGPPIEERLKNARRMRRDLGSLRAVEVRETPAGVRVTVEGDKGPRAALTFGIEAAALHRLTTIMVEVG